MSLIISIAIYVNVTAIFARRYECSSLKLARNVASSENNDLFKKLASNAILSHIMHSEVKHWAHCAFAVTLHFPRTASRTCAENIA
jgi:tetrahydromethanopterin S-methyltransferase subunit E